jgi:hypothetical protein
MTHDSTKLDDAAAYFQAGLEIQSYVVDPNVILTPPIAKHVLYKQEGHRDSCGTVE